MREKWPHGRLYEKAMSIYDKFSILFRRKLEFIKILNLQLLYAAIMYKSMPYLWFFLKIIQITSMLLIFINLFPLRVQLERQTGKCTFNFFSSVNFELHRRFTKQDSPEESQQDSSDFT